MDRLLQAYEEKAKRCFELEQENARLRVALTTAERDFEAMKNGCGSDYLMKAAASVRNVLNLNNANDPSRAELYAKQSEVKS